MDYFLIEQAARQFATASIMAQDSQQLQLLNKAITAAQRAITDHDKPSSIALASELFRLKAIRTGDDADWNVAIEFAKEMTERDPQGIGSWKGLGDLLWQRGRHIEAAQAYERALESDANFELDELKQLSQRDHDQLDERIAQVKLGNTPGDSE